MFCDGGIVFRLRAASVSRTPDEEVREPWRHEFMGWLRQLLGRREHKRAPGAGIETCTLPGLADRDVGAAVTDTAGEFGWLHDGAGSRPTAGVVHPV